MDFCLDLTEISLVIHVQLLERLKNLWKNVNFKGVCGRRRQLSLEHYVLDGNLRRIALDQDTTFVVSSTSVGLTSTSTQ